MAPAFRFSTATGLTMQRVRSTGICDSLAGRTLALVGEIPLACNQTATESGPHHAGESGGHVARGRRHANAGRFEDLDLLGRGALSASDDGPRVTHTLSRR